MVGELGAEAHAELRAVIDGLAPPDLEAAGLAESLRRYAVLAGRAHGVPVTFCAACLPPLSEQAEAALYRVAQEALHNALRHAGASGVKVSLAKTPRQVVLEVSDDGHGFDAGRAVRRPRAGLDAGARGVGRRQAGHQVEPRREPRCG